MASKLETLIASKNALSGALPSELGNLIGMKNMLTFQNSLTGSIPSEMGRMTKLKRLRVHENPDLCGLIPAFGEQLQSFT